MTPADRQRIMDLLWPENAARRLDVWTILDSARDDRIFGLVDGTYLEKCCLYAGDLPWQLQVTAPYLVQLKSDDRLTRYVIDEGWGNSWGIFFRAESGIKTLRRHFREFLRVRDSRGKRLIFRYYDPRVMRVYLPTCFPDELRTMFGPVHQFLMENENGNEMIEFSMDGPKLVEKRIGLKAAVSQP